MSQYNHSELEPEDGPEHELYAEKHRKRIRIVAWTAIIALVIVGGGASILALLFG
jgi:hypothetical protein